MPVQQREIDLDDETDRYRYRCPKGHASWEPTNEHFYCASCAQHHDADSAFEELVDHKTRERLPREQVKLTSEAGDYENWRVIG